MSSHDEALWGGAFPGQQMQQSLHAKEPVPKAFSNSHDIDQHCD